MTHRRSEPDQVRRWLLMALAGNLVGCGGRNVGMASDVDGGESDGGPPLDAGSLPPDAGDVECDEPDGAYVLHPCPATVRDLEGPYYEEGAPVGSDLVAPGMPGEAIWVSGSVYGVGCRLLGGATLDIWHADAEGQYDNEGWTLRRVMQADDEGAFAFRTVLPGYYGTRPRHIHIKVSAPGHAVLTTQLYFDEDPKAPDCGPRKTLRLELEPSPDGERVASFDFVLDALAAERR